MKPFLYLIGLGFVALCAFVAPAFRSKLQIAKHEQLIMSHPSGEAFWIKAYNESEAQVTVFSKTDAGVVDTLIVLFPDIEAKCKAPAHASLIFRNETRKEANLTVSGPGTPDEYDMLYQKQAEWKH